MRAVVSRKLSWILAIPLIVIIGCSKDDGINVELNSEINEFIWQGLRTYYLWQEEVPDLTDDRFETFDQLHTFLNRFSTPELLFNHFLHQDDRFSWIVSDFEELDKALQGISRSFGYEYNLVRIGSTNNIFGYVQYVLTNSPAETAGLKRGDVFHSVNGIRLTQANFNDLLFAESQVLGLGNFLSINETVQDNGKTISMSSVEISENPVFLTKTFEVNETKVGYLVYNRFINSFHGELNAAIGQLKSEGVSEMVLDLRYNPGGSINTARLLSSMLYDDATSETVLGSIIYNSRLSEFNSDLTFMEVVKLFDRDGNEIGEEAINRLDLNRLFILTGGATASASELVIAGLQPYLDLTLIGTTTVGKNVGSVTLYDSPDEGYLSKTGINPNHTYAMQPIISQLANSVGFTDYVDGIQANVEISELQHIGNLKPLGDETEPLLAEALSIVSGTGRSIVKEKLNLTSVYNSHENRAYSRAIIDSKSEIDKLLLTKFPF